MKGTREYLLELDKKRLEMEKEIFELTDFLTADGMPGVSGPLIDREGFPLPNIDHMAVRTARNKLIYKQNDLKDLMLQIEKEMQEYFKSESERRQTEKQEETKPVDRSEPIKVTGVPSDEQSTKSLHSTNIKIPFAYVGLVTEGSPAEEAGLRPRDGLINLDDKVVYGYYQNPLLKVSEIVKAKINQEIHVEVMRSNLDEEGFERIEYVKLVLTPHEWAGQGVLGCKLNLEKN